MGLVQFVTSWVLAAALVACGGDEDAGKTVKDQAGRTCTIHDGAISISCDAVAQPHAPCENGWTACFRQGVANSTTATIGPAAVCAGCCTSNQSESTTDDCTPIVCRTVDDCPHGSMKCDNTDSGCY